jgi:hypothetical protein
MFPGDCFLPLPRLLHSTTDETPEEVWPGLRNLDVQLHMERTLCWVPDFYNENKEIKYYH